MPAFVAVDSPRTHAAKNEILFLTELEERMHDLKNELDSYNSGDSDETNKKKALEALKRMERWNLFKETSEVSFVQLLLLCSRENAVLATYYV